MNLKTILMATTGVALAAAPAMGQVFEVNAGKTPSNSSWVGTIGYSFTPTANVAVTQLGAFDFGSYGNGTVHIDIWQQGVNGAPVATAAIDLSAQGSPVDVSTWTYVFATLGSPVTLSAGVTYILTERDATGSTPGSVWKDIGKDNAGTGPNTIAFNQIYKYGAGTSLNPFQESLDGHGSFSTYSSSDTASLDPFMQANMVLAPVAVPEPSTYAAVAGLGLLGFAAFRKFRR